jgi:hypothetical protein
MNTKNKQLVNNCKKDPYRLTVLSVCFILSFFLFVSKSNGQSSRYWTHNFNEESSILGGAVIGGGAGPSAIYYNPANISDVENSSFSFNISLFSLDFYKLQNALGNGIDLKKTTFRIQPRFISLIIRPEKNKKLSLQFASLNRESHEIEFAGGVESFIDIINSLPGEERYIASYRYKNSYSDDYIGAGAAYQTNDKLSIGTSMFVSIKTLDYYQITEMDAHPLSDTITIGNESIPFYSASAINNEYVKFTDFRLLWKFGLIYKIKNLSMGLSITTPSVTLYSDGRYVSGKISQSNIKQPDGESFLPNFIIADGRGVRDFSVNYKDPFSVSAGIKYDTPNGKNSLFISAAYYAGLKPYKMIDVPVNPNITTEEQFNKLENKEWLSYAYGANPIVNLGIGFRWKLSHNFLLLTGLKTDFDYLQDFDYKEYENYKKFTKISQNVYYLSAGGRVNIKRVNLFAGLQYAHGNSKNKAQIINFAAPVEFNETEQAPLQGDRENNMDVNYNSITLLFGATLSFIKKDKTE